MIRRPRIAGWPAPALATALFLATAAAGAEELPFETAIAEIARAPLERIYDGTVEAVNQATVSAQTAGRIAEAFYDVDDYVEPGNPIVRRTRDFRGGCLEWQFLCPGSRGSKKQCGGQGRCRPASNTGTSDHVISSRGLRRNTRSAAFR